MEVEVEINEWKMKRLTLRRGISTTRWLYKFENGNANNKNDDIETEGKCSEDGKGERHLTKVRMYYGNKIGSNVWSLTIYICTLMKDVEMLKLEM